MTQLTEGPYGFAWGPLEVTRLFSQKGRVCLRIRTDAGREVEVYCSPTGRSLRVFTPGGGEWAPASDGT